MRTFLLCVIAISAIFAFNLPSNENTTDPQVSYCGKLRCKTSCGPSWNKKSGQGERCCPGSLGTKNSCSKSCSTSANCVCDLTVSAYNPFSNHQCSYASSHKRELDNLQYSLDSLKKLMKNEAGDKGISFNWFLSNILMEPFKKAYDYDRINLVGFQALMSQDDPPPPSNSNFADFFFGIFTDLLKFLPDVGDKIELLLKWSRSYAEVQGSTKYPSNAHNYDIAWKQFVVARSLTVVTQMSALEDGLLNYLDKFYAKHNIPKSGLKNVNSAAYGQLVNLITILFKHQKTATQSFVELLADYLNSVNAGIVVAACDKSDEKTFQWRISKVNSNVAITNKLLELTNHCINPTTNFKDSRGKSVKQALFACTPTGLPRGTKYWYGASSAKTAAIVGNIKSTDFKVCKKSLEAKNIGV